MSKKSTMHLGLCLSALVALTLQMCPAAYAEQPHAVFQAETPEVDSGTTPVGGGNDQEAPVLRGGLHKSEFIDQPSETSQSPEAAPAADPMKLRAQALEKLKSGKKLTGQDLRDLNVGIVGYDTVRTYFQDKSSVSDVYPGCPAAVAGMKVGDIIMDHDHDDSGVKDPTVASWVFSCGIAGEPMDVQVIRHGKTLDFHLIQMNMEDIPDLKLRRQFEQLVEETGAPAHNVPIPAQADDEPEQHASHVSPARLIFGLLGLKI